MKKQKKTANSKKRIADEILHQIGGSVVIVFLLIAVFAICMVGWLSITSKKTELTEESKAAANQLIGFLEQYMKSAEQLAVNPEVKYVMEQTKAGDDIRKTKKINTVTENLLNITNTDSENILSDT